MLDKNLVYDVLSAALSEGGDFAEVFFENKELNNMHMINGILEKSLSGINFGIGIRIFNGFNHVYVYTNDLSRENLLKVAKNGSSALRSQEKATKNKELLQKLNFVNLDIENKHKIKFSPIDYDKKKIIDFLRNVSKTSCEYNSAVTETNGLYSGSVQDVLIANTDGLWVTDRRVYTRVFLDAIASKTNEKQTGSFRPGAYVGAELLDTLDSEKIGKEIAETAVTMLNADYCPGGKMPVVIDNAFGGVIFHEACGHSLEATSVAKGASVFCDKLGEKIASDVVTAIDDGTLENNWGSLNVDDEGTKTQRNVLIENGILKSYLIDKLNGKKMGMESTGSGRRESYKFAPTSRMTNTFIAKGNSTTDDIISSVDYGLYAKSMGGGSVTPATGDFNFSVLEGYIIRNGKIAEPVKGATLIGKGSEILMSIDMVSDNLTLGQGMCGSLSGSVPTNVGQPMIRVSEITVGGRSK